MDDRLTRLRAGLVVAGMCSGIAGEAAGSGFQLRENSAAALGSAFAGAAALTQDPSIIANNPAGMTGLSGHQVSGDLSIVIPSAIFTGTGLNPTRQTISGGNGGDAGSAQPVPALYGAYDASPDLKLGLALTVPFGLKSQYNSDWVGRYQAVKSELDIININPNIAYRVTNWFSVGGGPGNTTRKRRTHQRDQFDHCCTSRQSAAAARISPPGRLRSGHRRFIVGRL